MLEIGYEDEALQGKDCSQGLAQEKQPYWNAMAVHVMMVGPK
jgi:hypothetical protein